MKKTLLLPLVLLLFCGCTSKVESYLREHESNLESLEIIEESDIYSVYSPHRELMSLSLEYSGLLAELSKLHSKAFEAKSSKEAVSILNNAIKLYDANMVKLDSITDSSFKAIDYPSLANKTNRKCIKAKYRINGILREQIFYLNKDEKTVGHTELDLRKYANDILYQLEKLRESKTEMEKDKKDIARGEYSF